MNDPKTGKRTFPPGGIVFRHSRGFDNDIRIQTDRGTVFLKQGEAIICKRSTNRLLKILKTINKK